MTSLILRTAIAYILPLLLLLSAYLLLYGHEVPGGGFVAGLVASAGYALYAIAFGVERSRRLLRIDPRILIGLGLLTALLSGLIPLVFRGQPFLTGLWSGLELPVGWKFGTPLLFDTGVSLVVIGATLTMIFSLAED